jgi:hypothetical protein
MKRSDRVSLLEEAKDQFKTSWERGRLGQTWRSGIRWNSDVLRQVMRARRLLMAIAPWLGERAPSSIAL